MDYNAKLNCHYQTKQGWVNDPNGLVYFQGYYHVFYQHAPHFERPWNEPMHWGHARTKDFLHWEELPVALTPDMPYDREGCWSGTAIVKDDTLYLFYASIPDPRPFDVQTVSVAYSKDGIHFEKYAGNPVIGGYPADGCRDFRDPAVTEIGGVYYCVMASGNPEQTAARLLLYRSEDLLHWEYAGIMCEWEGGRCTECPSFMQSGESFLLTASVCWPEGHNFSVMYGDFAEGKYTVKASAEVDKGPDQYAGQVFRDHKGRCILMSWIPGWSYDGYTDHDVGCMSVPREMKWENGRIAGYPVEELQYLLKDEDPSVERTESGFVIRREGREPVVYEGEIRDLKILRDEYIVEVFVNGGEEIYSALL